MSTNSIIQNAARTYFVVSVDKRPDFIALQIQSLKKYCLGDFELVVLNNSQNKSRAKKIMRECERLGARHLRVNFIDRETRSSHFESAFRFGRYISPNVACSYPYHWFVKQHLPTLLGANVVFIDSDMFLVKPVDFSKLLLTTSLFYVPQFRGFVDKNSHEVLYPWNALMFANTSDEKLNLADIQWSPKIQKGYPTDVGGASTSWLDSAVKNTPVCELLSFGILNYRKYDSNIGYRVSLNGNWLAEVQMSTSGNDGSFKSHDSLDLASRILQCEPQEVEQKVVTRLLEAVETVNPSEWPDPVWIDLLSAPGIGMDNFVLHYKSGSNYQEWATSDYNSSKTSALTKFFPLLA